MTSKVLELETILEPDRLATRITDTYLTYDMLRQPQKNEWEEVRRYIFATDTTQTSNSQLPWKNKTTIPKLCQIRDNLYANYIATEFPQRKSVVWEANEKDSNSVDKRDAIANYMTWVMDQPSFKSEMDKIILDYIDYGNCFATVEWLDERVDQKAVTQTGFIGPVPRRISPYDIVMNPTTESFGQAPKIIRSFISQGELKKLLEQMSTDENRDEYEELYKYLTDIRSNAQSYQGDWNERDRLYQMDGFGSFRDYLQSNLVEVLTFYGDIYDADEDILLENHVITVVDRHKLIGKKPNPSFFGNPPIFHSAWRKRQDNLWGMGPLANLIGMQYRLDHVENMKADIFDLVTYPVTKIKGFVEDFTWQPGEKIWVSEEGDVDLVTPDVQVLQANVEIGFYAQQMEEIAGAPKEAMGFRTPGEKTAYEVQSLENAAARIFQNKIRQFEEQIVEPLLNAMLEMARRNLVGATTIKIFDNDYNLTSFQSLTVEDITGIGRIKPVAAKHFAEQAQMIQNLTNLTNSNLWPFVQMHFSSYKLAKILEHAFNLQQYDLVMKNVNLGEQAEAQAEVQALQRNLAQETMTATGMGEDFDMLPPQLPPPEMNMPQEA